MLGIIGLETHYFFFFQSLQLQVITSVILMSYSDCDTFEKTYNSLYAFEYVIGDFLMHYCPSESGPMCRRATTARRRGGKRPTHSRANRCVGLVALALGRYTQIDYDVERVTAQLWLGNALLLTWDYFHSESPRRRRFVVAHLSESPRRRFVVAH